MVHYSIEPANDKPIETIRAFLKDLPEPPVALTTCVSGKGTLVRFIDMPKMNADDLRKSFALEADKYFPFPRDEIYHDCFILDKAERDNKMAVMVAAAKKELIGQRLTLFKELESQADYIVLDSIAIANAFHVLAADNEPGTLPSSQQAVAILDIGQRVSNLIILAGRQPRFCRDIFIGGHELTGSISNGFAISLGEAERLKLQPKSKQAEILKFTDSVMMNLVSELRLSFDYFITEKNIPIARLLLTGGGSLMEGLPEAFARALEIDVQPWNILRALNLPEDQLAEEVNKISGKFAVAIGMALYH